jgi:hypothetical protein
LFLATLAQCVEQTLMVTAVAMHLFAVAQQSKEVALWCLEQVVRHEQLLQHLGIEEPQI